MKTITISETLFSRLEREARQHGFRTIEQLLESQHTPDISPEERERRRAAVEEADAIRQKIAARAGTLPDSTLLVREDRER